MEVKVYDTKTILINLAKRDNGKVCVHLLRDFMRRLYRRLTGDKILHEYHISFDLNEDGIEKMVSSHQDLFSMDAKRETLFVNDKCQYDKYKVDEVMDKIIDDIYEF